MKTLILCGGKGTRAYPHTLAVPKPLLEVGDRPILEHVMGIYARQGFTDFVLAAGYKRHMIEHFADRLPSDWNVEVVDTGDETGTGERIRCCRDRLGDLFMATYGDGLSDIDLDALVRFHEGHPGTATLTTVALPSQYGTVELGARGQVERFREKPRLVDHHINGGFFVFDAAAFDRWEGDDLEREVLPALARTEQLFAYRHDGFWKSMDTYKDALELTQLGAAGPPPWHR